MALPFQFTDPSEVRLACRENRCPVFPSTTIQGYFCVNVVLLDVEYAAEFEKFCQANPISCPLLEVLPAGRRDCSEQWAADCDLTSDFRSYDIYEHGQHTRTCGSASNYFTERTVCFLIGSSVSFDGLLEEKGWKPSYGPCIYDTTVACTPVGPFRGNLAVTMRTFPADQADQVAAFTSHFPACHGGPIAINDPQALGITDDKKWLLPPPQKTDIPIDHHRLYWGCGITPSRVAQSAKLPLMIVHTPGNALVTDVKTIDLYQA